MNEQTDMMTFAPAVIERAGKLLGCQLDEQTVLKALIVQQDSGLSIARGEISIVPFKGKNAVFINKQGYLAYANRQAEYDGMESGVEEISGEVFAWCKVYRKDRSRPSSVKISLKEFGKSTPVWQQMPRYMLEKTAQSLALRQAFPILNGTLTEEEVDEPYTIERRASDIDVTPAPLPAEVPKPEPAKPAPKAEPVKAPANPEPVKQVPAPKRIYTAEQVQTIIDNMVGQGLEIPSNDFFNSAKMQDGTYNGDLIDAEYKRIRTAKQTAAKQTAPSTAGGNPAENTCPKCGQPSMTPKEQLRMEMVLEHRNFDHKMCKSCAQAWYDEQKAQQLRAAKVQSKYPKCEQCGRAVPAEELERAFLRTGKHICSVCWISQYKPEQPAQNTNAGDMNNA